MAARFLFVVALAAGVRMTLSCGSQSRTSSSRPKVVDQCYVHEKNPYFQFGGTTLYEIAHGYIDKEECEVIQVWMLARHGCRYPNIEDYEAFNKLKEVRKKILDNDLKDNLWMCREDISNLRTVVFDLPVEKAGQLMKSGKRELFDLGSRLRITFPELFSVDKLKGYKFLSTETLRVKESAEHFIKGLAKLPIDTKQLPIGPTTNQKIINPYGKCTKWLEETKKYKEERKVFQARQEMQKVLKVVAFRLGMKPGEELSMESLLTMYDACRLHKTLLSMYSISPWCAVFTREELEVLEYSVDLYFYYRSGPGTFNLHKKLACPAIKSLIDSFRQGVSNPNGDNPSIFYFGHHVMLDILQVGLDLTTSSATPPPTPDNYHRQYNRDYRTSKTMPFAGNIIAVLYRCDGKEKVAFYRNEEKIRKLQYPGCDNGLCDWKMFEERYSKYVDDKSCTDMSWCNEP